MGKGDGEDAARELVSSADPYLYPAVEPIAPEKATMIVDAMGLFWAACMVQKRERETGQSDLENLNAGACAFISEVLFRIKEQRPARVALVFDGPGSRASRVAIYPGYKAQRPPPDPELLAQIPVAKELCTKLGLSLLIAPQGYEADDVIAKFAAEATDAQPLIIVSKDKDFYQLLRDEVVIIRPLGLRAELMTAARMIEAEGGLLPSQWVDRRAIEGDASDNLPSVKGAGPKTANKLLIAYQNLEGIYEHLDALTPKERTSFAAAQDDVFISRKLATLHPEVVDLPEDAGKLQPPTPDAAAYLESVGLGPDVFQAAPLYEYLYAHTI